MVSDGLAMGEAFGGNLENEGCEVPDCLGDLVHFFGRRVGSDFPGDVAKWMWA